MSYTSAQRAEMEALYEAGNYYVETKVVIGGQYEYREDEIVSLETTRQHLKSGRELVGNAISGEIELVLRVDGRKFDVNATIEPYMRMVRVDGNTETPLYWIKKGVFFIETREINADRTITTIHGYDFMSKFDTECTLENYLNNIGSSVSTNLLMNELCDYFDIDFTLTVPGSFSYGTMTLDNDKITYRELLEEIASNWFGNFVFNDDGVLEFIQIEYQVPSFLLVDEYGNYITFGGNRILLR